MLALYTQEIYAMNYVIDIDWGAIIFIFVYTLSFIKIGSSIEKMLGDINLQAHRKQSGFISIILFFRKEK
jgi:hypothetical protein